MYRLIKSNGLAMSRILKLKNKMNMKNLIKYGFIAVVICFFTACEEEQEQEIKVGQIWRYYKNDKNPFEPTKYVDQEIIAIRNGYVQYKEEGKLYSYRIELVKINADCINCR